MSLVNIYCPVCDNNKFNTFQEIFDDRYGEPNLYHLAKCTNCNHIATYPRTNQKDLGRLYKEYYPRKNISHKDIIRNLKPKKTFQKYLINWFQGTYNQGQVHAQKGENVLDIGCGDCSSLLEIENIGAKAYGIETDENVSSIAKSLNLQVHIGSIEDNPFPDKSFDLIIMNQVIEHIPEPDKSLKLIMKRLSPNGRLIMVFPNIDSIWQKLTGNKWINWHVPYHLHHFNKKSFEKVIFKCGLKLVKCQTITPNIWTLLQFRHLFYKTKKGSINRIWKLKKTKLINKSKNIFQIKFINLFLKLLSLLFIGIINRIIDMANLGDSLMVEVKIKK